MNTNAGPFFKDIRKMKKTNTACLSMTFKDIQSEKDTSKGRISDKINTHKFLDVDLQRYLEQEWQD